MAEDRKKRRESLYYDAARLIDEFEGKKGSLKSLAFKCKGTSLPRKKALFVLLEKTIQKKEILSQVIKESKLLEKTTKLTHSLCLVILYELFYGKEVLTVKGPLTRSILKHNVLLHQIFNKITKDSTSSTLVTKIELPRYIRVNTLKCTSSLELTNELTRLGLKEMPFNKEIQQIQEEDNWFSKDSLIPDLYVLPHSIKLTGTSLYTSGKIILQDKSSCIASYVLSPPPGANVIDACAAPGSKTSHIAALMKNTGRIYAFDRDKGRCNDMKGLLRKYGITCATVFNMDFLKVCPEEYSNVQYILVDPSCSGSGLVRRQEIHNTVSAERLASLSRFQCMILKHALSFPSVKRVVYSTCSVHAEENEGVVAEVLSEYEKQFQLVHILSQWTNRGLSSYHGGSSCVRVVPSDDLCQGFFVALFARKTSTKQQQQLLL